MASLRFPFLFSQPGNAKLSNISSRSLSAAFTVAAAAAAGGAAALVLQNPKQPFIKNAMDFLFSPNRSSPLWGSLSLADNSGAVVESKTGFSFPSIVNDSRLLGVGLRKKSVLGLKNINVYAFGVYADGDGVQKLLGEKYRNLPASELKGNKAFIDDLMEADIRMTVRLQIVYGKLSIRSVRSAFEESVGNRLQKFGGSDNKELLQRFTSQFKDEYKIPRGSVIDLSREQGYVLRTTIDGKEVGRIQSKILCRSILDLYIGEDPFDRQAKEDVEVNAASLFQK
ncbi:fatty-acid-binding protein 1 isoform X2 [Carica papaya]|uniref:fatty-acid-binding protein 1 isoform X2 n=1 Tax=Carica papaya TaxID=3649 RepID=UPI000B8D1324|nr:fatty-acid-binding protein 1 isoform X2 [Carica papaya]